MQTDLKSWIWEAHRERIDPCRCNPYTDSRRVMSNWRPECMAVWCGAPLPRLGGHCSGCRGQISLKPDLMCRTHEGGYGPGRTHAR